MGGVSSSTTAKSTYPEDDVVKKAALARNASRGLKNAHGQECHSPSMHRCSSPTILARIP
jgi:hypothetical protein